MKKEIYLDYAATSPVKEENAEKIFNFIKNSYANPSSKHLLGRKAREEMEKCREKIAKLINAKPEEIIFTSGATESNNLALSGVLEASNGPSEIIVSKIEHPSILEVCKNLSRKGIKVRYANVNKEGIVNPEEIKSMITDNTKIISIMHVNNEIGTIQPIKEIAELCSSKKILFHTDAVQSFCKIKFDAKEIKASLASFSGHKIGALKGIGFLYVKNGIKISPTIVGGGQEKNLRSGTENTAGIYSLSLAIENHLDVENIKKSRNLLLEALLKLPGTILNGSIEKRIFNNLNLSFYGTEAEALVDRLSRDGIFVSSGSACASTKMASSHVLEALGLDPLYVNGGIRITLGEPLKKEDLNYVISRIRFHVEELRRISPFKLNLEEEK